MIGLLVLCSLTRCADKRGPQALVPELNVLTLAKHDVRIPRDYVCEIQAVQYVEIHARVQGYLEEIFVDEGQLVKKGQPLFRISSNEYREMVAKAEASLQRAIAEAKAKDLEVERIRVMVDKKIISSSELALAHARLEAAQSTVREAKSVLENARIHLSYTFIRSPFDGILDRIPFKRGSLINSGTLLTSVSNIDQVFAYFRVTELEYLKLQGHEITGQKFSKQLSDVSLILADQTTYPSPGVIETMEGDFDRSTGTIALRARFTNRKGLLKHGASGKIRLVKTWEDAVLIPQESVFSIQDKNYVFIIDASNKVRAKSFNAIERYDDYFLTLGLSPGSRVVATGIQQLREGSTIKPRDMRDTLTVSALSAKKN
jgi:membrane fusion protein (multidrug efflux system)